jgi:VanZ family protein
MERKLDRFKFDTARKMNVPAPYESGPSRWSQDFVGTFVMGCLLVVVIAVFGAIETVRDGRRPIVEVAVVVGVITVLIALLITRLRRRPR